MQEAAAAFTPILVPHDLDRLEIDPVARPGRARAGRRLGRDPNRAIVLYAQGMSDVPVGGWDPDALPGAAFERARREALAELEPLKAELRERAQRIAEREATTPADASPEEVLARRARDLAAAERAAFEELDTRSRALDLRARELARRARELDSEGPGRDPGFVRFSEGFEAFAERRRTRRTPGR